jgi:hypothetical protein
MCTKNKLDHIKFELEKYLKIFRKRFKKFSFLEKSNNSKTFKK